ncbi:CocE/NonD family hydrolase C-terminal non-catalytic domain-containing protein [Streptomyces sp. adm13(2018)]|uniref:CocE/NonD family hydrolase C-terminal non-catalytic domain-containing protein n=1 Tax=Streptomyces sp. adm13(2018) TaxID=2479007 RepID=UPI003967C6BF
MARGSAGRSRPFEPVPACLVREPVPAGEVVPVDLALGPSSTLFRAGEQLRLVVAGRWLSPRNPLTGQFPASYRTRSRGRCTLHWARTAQPISCCPSSHRGREAGRVPVPAAMTHTGSCPS